MDIYFSNNAEVFAGVSEVSHGSMVWLNTLPVDPAIEQNRNNFFKTIGVDPARSVSGGLVHGVRVATVNDQDAGTYLLNTDALITNVPNLFLTITFADCTPVYFYDPVTQAIGIAHAGWRGTAAGILERVVEEMHRAFNVKPEDLHVVLGPNIKPHHYEVGQEVADAFHASSIEKENGKMYADLSAEAKLRLEQVGVKNIIINSTCTYCANNVFSARRDKNVPLKGGMAFIGMRN